MSRLKNADATQGEFPWRKAHHVHLLQDGPAFFPAMLAAMATARQEILLEMYLVASGEVMERFMTALIAAAARGVSVYVLFDDFGARPFKTQDRERLRTSGVHLRFHNPLYYRWHWSGLLHNLHRNHRKLLLVDRHTVFIGGMGLTDAFDPPAAHGQTPPPWREVVLRVDGPVALDWRVTYMEIWDCAQGQGAALLETPAHFQRVSTGGVRARVCASRPNAHHETRRALLAQLRCAKKHIYLATAYFLPSWRIRHALMRAVRRGVDVRILVPGPHTDHPAIRRAGQRYYARLLRHGVRIYEYQPRFWHAKVWLCDDWVSIGSSNIDHWTLYWNLEANQEVLDPSVALEVEAMLRSDWAFCHERTWAEWRQRPWHRRWRESFWGTIDRWIRRLTGG